MSPDAISLTARIRRLSRDGDQLYVQFIRRELDALDLRHLTSVTMRIDGCCQVGGIMKTSGATPWLAPGDGWSNQSITAALRKHGLAHGQDLPAIIAVTDSTVARRPVSRPTLNPLTQEQRPVPRTQPSPSDHNLSHELDTSATMRLADRVQELAGKQVRLWLWDPYILGHSPTLDYQVMTARQAGRLELERWRRGRFPTIQLAVADAVFSKQKRYRAAVLSAIHPFAIAWGESEFIEFCELPWPTIYERTFGTTPRDPENPTHNHLSPEGRVQTILAASQRILALGFTTTNSVRTHLVTPAGNPSIKDELKKVRGLGDALISNTCMNLGALQAKLDTHVRRIIHECTSIAVDADASRMATALSAVAALTGYHVFEIDQIIWYALAEPA